MAIAHGIQLVLLGASVWSMTLIVLSHYRPFLGTREPGLCFLKTQYGPQRGSGIILPHHWKRQRRRGQISATASLSASTSGTRRLVEVRADDSLSVPVSTRHDAGADLSTYMGLPVSQFVLLEVPMGAELTRVGPEFFELLVPRLELFGLWVQPRVKCIVRSDALKVDIRSVNLVIEGSEFVQRWHLNERVDFNVHCQLTHTDGPAPAIRCESLITARVDPPAIFSCIPDGVLSGTASAVVKASLSALQGTVVPSLAADYSRWATSSAYREQRRQHAICSDAALGVQ